MGNLLTGVVVVVFLCTAVVLLVINRTSMTETALKEGEFEAVSKQGRLWFQ